MLYAELSNDMAFDPSQEEGEGAEVATEEREPDMDELDEEEVSLDDLNEDELAQADEPGEYEDTGSDY